jgi:hypothetical protein
MCTHVVFTLIVGQVFLTGVPFFCEFFLCYFVSYPKIPHFHLARSLAFDSVVRDAYGGGVIAVYWCTWLGMAKFFEGESKNYSLFAIEE